MPTRPLPPASVRLAPAQALPGAAAPPADAAPIAIGRLAALVHPDAAGTLSATVVNKAERPMEQQIDETAHTDPPPAPPAAGALAGPSGPLAAGAGRHLRLVWAFVVCLACVL